MKHLVPKILLVALCLVAGMIGSSFSRNFGTSSYTLSYADFVSILLTAVSLLMTLLGFFIAVLAYIGWNSIGGKVASDVKEFLAEGFKDGNPLHKLLVDATNRARYEGVQNVDLEFTDEVARIDGRAGAGWDVGMSAELWARMVPEEAVVVRRYMEQHPVRVGELAAELGLKVFKSPLQPNVSGLIRPTEDGNGFEIRVNKYEVPERQRFTLAHEIAHFLIHKNDIQSGVVDSVMYRSALTSRKEAEANRLAAEIIMPAAAVRRELAACGGVASEEVAAQLASTFKVSPPAMRVRLGIA